MISGIIWKSFPYFMCEIYFFQYSNLNKSNNSPIFKLPPIWRIMNGCGNQQLSLTPFDSDGDTVRVKKLLQNSDLISYNIIKFWHLFYKFNFSKRVENKKTLSLVRCRWATEDESDTASAHDNVRFGSLKEQVERRKYKKYINVFFYFQFVIF